MAAKNSLHKTDIPKDGQFVALSRLKNRADFISARNGTRSHRRAFVMQLHQRNTAEPNNDLRVGFTVTTKIGNAVIRNRIKRRFREAIKQITIPEGACGHDLVLIARRIAADLPFQQLVKDVEEALTEAVLLSQEKNNT
ncbi:MAG: ribonuclease P protein component [Rhizobiaceae bacterium]